MSSVRDDVIEAANGSVRTAPSFPAQGPKKRGTFCSMKSGIGPFGVGDICFLTEDLQLKPRFCALLQRRPWGPRAAGVGPALEPSLLTVFLPWLLAPALRFLRRHGVYSFV